jgi:hypothetical protein
MLQAAVCRRRSRDTKDMGPVPSGAPSKSMDGGEVTVDVENSYLALCKFRELPNQLIIYSPP